jgi:hypothetical protein
MDNTIASGSALADQVPRRARDAGRHDRQLRLPTLLRQVLPVKEGHRQHAAKQLAAFPKVKS